jgi:hypothetical protein
MNRLTFFTQEKIEEARSAFQQLTIKGPEDGDKFFEKFGIGNTINIIDRPFERFEDYEFLLQTLKNDDPSKYKEIHKGTPFYFLAWTAFDLKNYEKAVFYMDAAIAEDMRKDPLNWLSNPASKFLTLDHQGNQSANRITCILNTKVENEIQRFNLISKNNLNKDDFVNKFVKKLINNKNKSTHSIITAFYSYILEFDDRRKELELRSTEGGSMEPVLTFLFKGGLIFESLLKYLYPEKDDGSNCQTIGDVFKSKNFKDDFNNTIKVGAKSLKDVVDDIKGNDATNVFEITSKLRNTTGHNLVWDDVFNDPNNFLKLYQQQINAIFYLIQKKFL